MNDSVDIIRTSAQVSKLDLKRIVVIEEKFLQAWKWVWFARHNTQPQLMEADWRADFDQLASQSAQTIVINEHVAEMRIVFWRVNMPYSTFSWVESEIKVGVDRCHEVIVGCFGDAQEIDDVFGSFELLLEALS